MGMPVPEPGRHHIWCVAVPRSAACAPAASPGVAGWCAARHLLGRWAQILRAAVRAVGCRPV